MNNKPSLFANIPPAVLNIIIINVLVWMASIIIPQHFGIDLVKIFGLHYWKSSAFNPIQLFTYMFMHDTSGMAHIFCNMFGVFMFGRMLEQIWGTKKFLFFYFVAGVGAGIMQELTWMLDLHSLTSAMNTAIETNSGEALIPFSYMFNGDIARASAENVIMLKQQLFSQYVTVGASGALFGILLAFGWLFPEAKMGILFVPFMIPARIFVGIYAILELFLGVANFSIDNVAHFAHLGGMIFGAILLYIWQKNGKLYN